MFVPSASSALNRPRRDLYQPVPTSIPLLPTQAGNNSFLPAAAAGVAASDQGTRGPERDYRAENEAAEKEAAGRRLAELKTTVFDTYAICAALLASFACSTTFISEAELLQEVPWRRATVQLQQFVVRICIIGGIHAMLVFMFCALYAKSALARPTYGLVVYNVFSKQTGAVRQTAFWSMYYTAILYCLQIAVSTYYSLDWLMASVAAFILLLLLARVVHDAQGIIKTAGMVFMPDAAVRKMLDDEKQPPKTEVPEQTSTTRTSTRSSLEMSETSARSISTKQH